MKKSFRTLFALAVLVVFSSSCAIVKPGEIGVKQRLGKLSENTIEQGPHAFNPIFTKVIITSVQTENLELNYYIESKKTKCLRLLII